jgi:hypothetical protein
METLKNLLDKEKQNQNLLVVDLDNILYLTSLYYKYTDSDIHEPVEFLRNMLDLKIKQLL